MEWQPISTAPKDGTEILVYSKRGRTEQARYLGNWQGFGGDGWRYDMPINITNGFDRQPTHWMPLPAPPKQKQS